MSRLASLILAVGIGCGGQQQAPADGAIADAGPGYDVYEHIGECCASDYADGGPGSLPASQCVGAENTRLCFNAFCGFVPAQPLGKRYFCCTPDYHGTMNCWGAQKQGDPPPTRFQ